MGSQAAQAYDASAAAFFVETLCQESDLVFRLGYTLTLSEQGASELVLATYRSIVGELPNLLHEDSLKLRLRLFQSAWKIFRSWSQEFQPTDTPLLDFFSTMVTETRAVLVLIDGLGVTPFEVAKILNVDEIEVRRQLAEGRRKMVHFDS